jgi:sec-independent protein translocase protein TatA
MIGDLFDSPWKILIVAAVIIVLFGSAKLPHAARSLGKSMRILKSEIKDLHQDGPEPEAVMPAPAAVEQQLAAEQAQLRIADLQRQLADLEEPAKVAAVQPAQQSS